MDQAGFNARVKLENSDDEFDEFYDRTSKPMINKKFGTQNSSSL